MKSRKLKNVVIHPEDKSTDFLSPIYKMATSKRVFRKDNTLVEVIKQVSRSDRVLMMGHGCPSGLFSINHFKGAGSLIVSDQEVELLKDKPESVYIWCNADKFVQKHDLHGFYSGMFISEVGEANYCGVQANQEMVDESNNTFSKIVGKYIHLTVAELYEKVKEEYGVLAESNPVARYNHERLYLR